MKMKKLLFLLLFVCSTTFGQMKRTNDTYNGVNFLRFDPPAGVVVQGAILYLHGIGERGNDTNKNPSIIEHNDIAKQMATTIVPYIVICPQLPLNFGGWYESITNPITQYVAALPGHHHITGLSLGAMRVSIVVMENPGVFQSASTICGKNDVYDATSIAKIITEFDKIPSIHYYDPLDQTISGGYQSIKTLTDQLIQSKADCTLQLINMPSTDHHSIWTIAYQQQNFWTWLSSKVSPPPVPPSDPVITWNLINGILVGTTQAGKTINLTPNSIN